MSNHSDPFASCSSSQSAITCNFTDIDVNDTRWHYSCSEEYGTSADYYLFIVVIISNIILLGLSVRGNTKKWKFCWGRPGIIFPMNMLDGYENRLAYAATFGSMTFELTSILWNPYGRFTSFGIGHAVKNNPFVTAYPVVRLFLIFIQAGICTFMFYPLFFGLSTKYKFAGSIIGLTNAFYRLCYWFWLCSCVDQEDDILSSGFKVKRYMLPLLITPCIACMAVLVSQYIFTVIQCVRTREFSYDSTSEPVALPHHIEHVKLLLGKEELPWSEKSLSHVSIFNKQKFLQNFSFKRMPGFKFPARVIATFVVTTLAVYQIGIQVAFTVYSGLKVLRRYVRCIQQLIPEQFLVQFDLLKYADYVCRYSNIAANLWVAILAFDMVLAVLYVYHMTLCYRKHTLRVYRGERKMFPASWVREGSQNILTAASRHAGLQIAYTIWGFVIIHCFVYISSMIFVFIIIIPPSEFKYYGILIMLAQTVVASLILNLLIYFVQLLLSRFLFLQQKVNPDCDEPVPLALDNRHGWYNVSFFFFFWNLFLGIISALMRVVKGLVFGVFFIPRIDRPVLMRGFETSDNGFYAYLSLLSVINAHDHPVVKVFVQILKDAAEKKRTMVPYLTEEGREEGDHRYNKTEMGFRTLRNTYRGSKRARYYWSLAFTLINNPDLLMYRKVEVDEVDGAAGREYGTIRKHKIVLAIQRKQKGLKTSEMYRIGEEEPVEQVKYRGTNNQTNRFSHA